MTCVWCEAKGKRLWDSFPGRKIVSHTSSIVGTHKWIGTPEVRSCLTSFMVLFR